ncbi:MAG TPA: hypothetical protein VKX28_26820 [Xanthobacteraceae bacterium]|nr:hypothetical protein [Xanthobacteraceae bacterium]
MRIERAIRAIAALLLLVSAAIAQQPYSKSALTSQIGQDFPDQNAGAITPAILRGFLTNAVNSSQQYAGVNAQVGTSYTVQASDYGQLITFNNAGAVAVTLPQTVAGTFTFYPFSFYVRNLGAGTVTITPQNGSTINGAASLAITQGVNAIVISDGANYQVFGAQGFSPGGSGIIINGGSAYLNSSVPYLGTGSCNGCGPLAMESAGPGAFWHETDQNPYETGTAQAGTSTTITLASRSCTPVNGITAMGCGAGDYVSSVLTITGGTGLGQKFQVSAVSPGTSPVLTISGTFSPAPDSTSVYALGRIDYGWWRLICDGNACYFEDWEACNPLTATFPANLEDCQDEFWRVMRVPTNTPLAANHIIGFNYPIYGNGNRDWHIGANWADPHQPQTARNLDFDALNTSTNQMVTAMQLVPNGANPQIIVSSVSPFCFVSCSGTNNLGALANNSFVGNVSGSTGPAIGVPKQAAFDGMAPAPTRAGDIIYWNGTHWVNFAGNNSGTSCLSETSSGVPGWSACSGGSGTPGGSNTQLQYNSSGVFGGITGVTSNGTNVTIASGDLLLGGATSGTTTLNASGTASGTATLPANTGTIAELNLAQTWSAPQTFNNNDLLLAGSSSGTTTLNASATASGTATLPANSGTVAEVNFAQTWSAAQTFNNNDLLLAGSSSGTTTLNASSIASGTLTLPAATDTLIARATIDTLTNKTYDTAGTGNSFKINGTSIAAVTGTGSVVLATSPTISGATLSGTTNASGTFQIGGFTIGATSATSIGAGQYQGTATNDNATAGNIGEFTSTITQKTSATVTISNASPGIISWTAHGLGVASSVSFTTTGSLPTGLSPSTNYYVCSGSTYQTNSFAVATSPANALAGTCINTSSAGSGTQTGTAGAILTAGNPDSVSAISLTAGDWQVCAGAAYTGGATTTATYIEAGLSTTTNTLDTTPGRFVIIPAFNSTPFSQADVGLFVCDRFSLSGTTTIFQIAQSSFGTSTMSAYGKLWARRMR